MPAVAVYVRIGGDPASLGNWPEFDDFIKPGVGPLARHDEQDELFLRACKKGPGLLIRMPHASSSVSANSCGPGCLVISFFCFYHSFLVFNLPAYTTWKNVCSLIPLASRRPFGSFVGKSVLRSLLSGCKQAIQIQADELTLLVLTLWP